MRRFLAALVSGAAGLVAGVFAYTIDPQAGIVVGAAVILGVYGAIDRLGLLPEPFDSDVRSLLHDRDDDPSHT